MKKKSPIEWVNLMFSAIMVLLTFTGSLIFAFTDWFEDRAYGTKRYILSVVFMAYSIYRIYRMYQAFQAEKVEQEEV